MAKGDAEPRSDGQIIRIWRTIRGHSQLELQNLAGLAKGRVSKIETGETSPTLEEYRAIASALGVPITEMVRMSEQLKAHVLTVLEKELAALEGARVDHDTGLRLIQAVLDRLVSEPGR